MRQIIILILLFVNIIAEASNFKIQTISDDYEIANSKSILEKYLTKIDFQIQELEEVEFNLTTSSHIKDILPNIYSKIKSFKNDGYIIKLIGKKIYIIGTNNRSLNYGIYSFLENSFKLKFLTNKFEIIPQKVIIKKESINQISEARFNYREIFINELDDSDFAMKLALNGNFGHKAKKTNKTLINTYNNFTPYELIPLKYKDLYPEFFCSGQLDFTLKDVQENASLAFKKKLKDINPKNDDLFYLAHEDIQSYCNSRNSNNLIKKYNSTTAPFLEYSNYIAEDIQNENKNIKVFMEAYQWSRKAPKNFPALSSNLNIFFSDIEADFSKPINIGENKEIYKDLLSWQKYKRDIYIWHYITNFNGYLQPFPNIKTTAKDLKTYSSISLINGIFLQGAYETNYSNLSNLRAWVLSKLMWNPNLDVNNLIKEFSYYYYAEAYNDVMEYFNLLDNSLINSKSKLEIKTSINSKYLNKQFIKDAKVILDKGMNKVNKDSIYYKHMEELYSGLDYVQLLRGSISINDKKRFKNFLENNQVQYYAEGSTIESLNPYFTIKNKEPLKPKLLKKERTQWIDFQEYQLKLCCSQIVYDKKASSNIAARMNGDKSDWGIQLDLNNIPKGKWSIYASIKIKKAKGLSKVKYIKPAIYYGIHGKDIKNLTLINTLKDEMYHEINIANLDIEENDSSTIWIRPAESSDVKYIYVDRIFVIKNK